MLLWFTPFFILATLIVFLATPQSSPRFRFRRLLLALILLHASTSLTSLTYCLIHYPFGEDPSGSCDLSYGRATPWVWTFFWGFLFNACYILFWEFMWRLKYRTQMVSLWHGMGDDKWTMCCQWLTCIFALPLIIEMVFLVALTLYLT